ncbi:MAG: LysM peptidoglycan-binding domain-containing protein [Bacteroidales bacterium]|nr:LysM peptidoglycan-binding domain-containing protein [Bacteroidales bacterium]
MSKRIKMVILSAAAALLSFDAVAADRSDFSSYEQYLKSAVASAGLPEKVAYMPLVLTGGDPSYVEGSAAGIWSVTAPIARHYGVAVSDGFDGRYDVEYCTSAALAYFSELFRRSGGDLGAAMAQYALAAGQASKSENFMALLSEACERYEAQRNGSAAQLVPLKLESAVLLPELCKALGMTASALKADNPAIIPGGNCLPANAIIRVTEAKAELFNQASGKLYESAATALGTVALPVAKQAAPVQESERQISADNARKSVTYRIKPGDTLGGIASRYHVSVSQLKKWNNLKSNNIRAGRTLTIYK